jgi:3-hydroxyisobutyrate dehydrogenase-like beta-hydroxyacid dehydrogenase
MMIGFIGLGTMGSGMVKNLLAKGYRVKAYNRSRKDIARSNLSIVRCPADLSDCDIVFSCVSNDEAVSEVLFGKKGLLTGKASPPVLVDCSTVSIDLTQEIADACNRKGIAFLDAPLTGSKLGAENANLMFMVGGDKKILDKHLEIFEAMGKKIVYCGPSTFGQRAKLALNLAQALILESYFESLVLAKRIGISTETMMDILDSSAAKNGLATFKMPFVLKGDDTPHFKLSLMRKDMRLASDEIKRLGLHLPLAESALQVYDWALEEGFGEKDWWTILKIIDRNFR